MHVGNGITHFRLCKICYKYQKYSIQPAFNFNHTTQLRKYESYLKCNQTVLNIIKTLE